jgi:hypothetical protein
MPSAPVVAMLRGKFRLMKPSFNERTRRQWAATEALALGHGGVTAVAAASGLSRTVIHAGIRELRNLRQVKLMAGRIRRPGGGRKRVTEKAPGLLAALEALVEPTTRGDPESPIRWTCKSVRRLARQLRAQRHRVGPTKVAALLRQIGYSLQGNRKTREGSSHPDRDAQFRHIHDQVKSFQKRGQPVISVDTKKKELVGDFRNGGREWRPRGRPEEVRVHDFRDEQLGKVIPYGVYDLTHNEGWVSVGIDHDTAEFAAEAILRWWRRMGRRRFGRARELMITADCGGSNGNRSRLWKIALQRLADRTGLTLNVCHFPPGTSKWNKIEHRLFCHITQNWRGKPLVNRVVIVQLIGATTTQEGLRVKAELDANRYPLAVEVSDEELRRVRLSPAAFHGDWNYSIRPSP